MGNGSCITQTRDNPWALLLSIHVPHLHRALGRTNPLHTFFHKFIPSISKVSPPRRKYLPRRCSGKCVRTHSPSLSGHPRQGYPSWFTRCFRVFREKKWGPRDTSSITGEDLQNAALSSQPRKAICGTHSCILQCECCPSLPLLNPTQHSL